MLALTQQAELLLMLGLFLAAMLYTSVGHAGASAYIAVMALLGVAPAVMRPTALVLNILVASFTAWRFARAGLFRWRTLWPFVAGAVPMAFVGGAIQLPTAAFRTLVGAMLLFAAARLLWSRPLTNDSDWHDPPLALALPVGAGIGLLSGLTGTGGGIFLSPLLLLFAWSPTRAASGVVAAFVLCNSIAGLLGNLASVRALPSELPWLAGAVLLGAAVGTTLGIRRLPTAYLLKALGLVLVIAGLKMFGVY